MSDTDQGALGLLDHLGTLLAHGSAERLPTSPGSFPLHSVPASLLQSSVVCGCCGQSAGPGSCSC